MVIVGGGFAGLGCAQRLAEHDDVRVTLIDRNNYHQFQPLLYQVATSQLAPSDIAHSLRSVFADQKNVDVKLAEISAVDPAARTVTSTDGGQWTRGRARARGRLAAELLRHAGRRGERVSAVLARRRHAAAIADPRASSSRSTATRADRARRAELRDRRWRADRRRGGGSDRRHAVSDRPRDIRRPRRRRRADPPARLRRRAAQAVLRQGSRVCREGARGEGRADPPRHGRQGGRHRPRAAVGRHARSPRGA